MCYSARVVCVWTIEYQFAEAGEENTGTEQSKQDREERKGDDSGQTARRVAAKAYKIAYKYHC